MVTEQMWQFNVELIEEVQEYKNNEKCSTEDAFTSVFLHMLLMRANPL